MYWEIGRLIVEDEQQGKTKATYGKAVLKNLSQQPTLEFGKGFDERNLNNIKAFYLYFHNFERSAYRIHSFHGQKSRFSFYPLRD